MKKDISRRGKKYRKGYNDGYKDGKNDTYDYTQNNYTQGYNHGHTTGLQTALKDAYDIVKQADTLEGAMYGILRLQKTAKQETPHRPIRISL